MTTRSTTQYFHLLRTYIFDLPLDLQHASYETHTFPRHWNETFVIQLVEQGVNEFYCGGQIHHAGAGSIVLINPQEVHTGRSVGKEPLVYRTLYPNAELFEKLSVTLCDSPPSAPSFSRPVVQDVELAGLFRKACLACEGANTQLVRQALLAETLSMILLRHSDRRAAVQAIGKETHVVKRAQEYLAENLHRNISLAELAQTAHLSVFHFTRVFRATAGLPPHEYLLNLRIARAKQLLSAGTALAEAAELTGFYDASHFIKRFKRIVGVSPGQYLQWRRY